MKMNDAFAQCAALLRRGIVSGSDVAEMLHAFEAALGCVGLSLNIGYGIGPSELCRGIDPEWPVSYLPHAGEDPAPRFLDRSGPFSIYSVAKHATKENWRAPLGRAFTKAGFVDAAIMRVGGSPDAVLAAYCPKGVKPFSDDTLGRLTAILPLCDLAFAPSHMTRTLLASHAESKEEALRRLGAYAVLGANEGDIWFSNAARKMFHRMFDAFGARGERRIERALRSAHARLLARQGNRVFHLRFDLIAELAQLPQAGSDASLLVTFAQARSRVQEDEQRPFEELLSPRQRVVARGLARGASVPELAQDLGISSEAVKSHAAEVYRRLGTASRADLARLYAMD